MRQGSRMPNNQYYQLDVVYAVALKNIVAVSTDCRQSLGMANSVVQNCQKAAELFVSKNTDVHPYITAQMNLPTMLGACMIASLNAKCHLLPSGACHGCAYRIGSVANQSESATDNAAYALIDRAGFMCHVELDNEDEPVRACEGASLDGFEKTCAPCRDWRYP